MFIRLATGVGSDHPLYQLSHKHFPKAFFSTYKSPRFKLNQFLKYYLVLYLALVIGIQLSNCRYLINGSIIFSILDFFL